MKHFVESILGLDILACIISLHVDGIGVREKLSADVGKRICLEA